MTSRVVAFQYSFTEQTIVKYHRSTPTCAASHAHQQSKLYDVQIGVGSVDCFRSFLEILDSMSYAYSGRSSGASSRPPYYSSYDESDSIVGRASSTVYSYARDSIVERIEDVKSRFGYGRRPRKMKSFWQEIRSCIRAAFSIANLLVIMWIFTLWWGERTIFQDKISQCFWESWENWVS